jgi:hypothetical protein
MLSQEQDNSFEDGSRATFHCWEGRGRGEQTVCQLYARRGGKVVEIGDPLERRHSGVGREASQCAWGGVVEDPPPTPRDDRVYAYRPPGQPAPRSARAEWSGGGFVRGLSLDDAAASDVVPAWAVSPVREKA